MVTNGASRRTVVEVDEVMADFALLILVVGLMVLALGVDIAVVVGLVVGRMRK
jgi:hypothetical protein